MVATTKKAGSTIKIPEQPIQEEIETIVKKLLEKYQDVFREGKALSVMAGEPMKINLKPDSVPYPVHGARPLPFAQRDVDYETSLLGLTEAGKGRHLEMFLGGDDRKSWVVICEPWQVVAHSKFIGDSDNNRISFDGFNAGMTDSAHPTPLEESQQGSIGVILAGNYLGTAIPNGHSGAGDMAQ
eukprot:snap_masked-scaffold103_size370364-processed-gene-1.13 protein:Tk07517 transcript:snap_masked-scaffold103_size370364-processed-gene-1.13-mRNA-1 annotation:"hypothetical protein DAPPUDRAFT_112904"